MDYLRSRVWALAALLTSCFAICVALLAPNLSSIHRVNDADSLIPIFVSLDRWTPFYWGQTRFGMLVPLLASLVRNPLLNLLFQTQFNILCLLGSFVLLDRLVNSAASGRIRLGRSCLAMSLWYLIVKNDAKLYQLLFLPAQPYVVSLFFMLASLTLAGYSSDLAKTGSWRFAGFAGLMLLALYVNEGIFPIALILVLAFPTSIYRENGIFRRSVAALVVIALEISVHSISSRYGTPLAFRFAPLSYMPDALTAMLDQLFVLLVSPAAAAVLGILVLGSIALAFVSKRSGVGQQVLTLLVLAMTSVSTALVTTALEWTEHNLYDVRYWTMPVLLILMCGTVFVASWVGGPRWPSLVSTVCAVLLAAVSVHQFGMPSIQRMERSILLATAYHQRALRSLGCTSLIGDPWQVWTSAFASRLLDPNHPITPITDRSQPMPGTQFDPAASKRERYCSISDDANYEPTRRSFSIPEMRVAGQVDRIRLMELP